jgi:hypothetical protein
MAEVAGRRIVGFKAKVWNLGNHKKKMDKGIVSSQETTRGIG